MGLVSWLKKRAMRALIYRAARQSDIDLKPYKPAAKRALAERRRLLKEYPGMKAGIKTTEFWLAVAAAVVGIFSEQLGIPLPKEALLAVVAYILNRAWVKGKAEAAKAE